jgi:hypothetical protein
MRDGRCSKCGSTTVYSQAGGVFFYNNTVHVHTSALDRAVPFVSFVCASCGYFENYIADGAKLAEVARTWAKVPAAAG